MRILFAPFTPAINRPEHVAAIPADVLSLLGEKSKNSFNPRDAPDSQPG